jgi:HTH-type transcriptional regulator/antitoxin HigA
MDKLIKTPKDHAEALQRLDVLMAGNPAAGTAEGNELELLAHLIAQYEKQNHDLGFPTPLEAICFRMDQQGL